MRKYIYFLLGLLCGAVFFSGTAVMANSGVLAQITSQIFFLNGEQTELFAYNIGGNNYIKLRDAAALFGADIKYIEETNSVYMEIPKKGIHKFSLLHKDAYFYQYIKQPGNFFRNAPE